MQPELQPEISLFSQLRGVYVASGAGTMSRLYRSSPVLDSGRNFLPYTVPADVTGFLSVCFVRSRCGDAAGTGHWSHPHAHSLTVTLIA
jgi:hypothetical protein